jgi:hypothetical protein
MTRRQAAPTTTDTSKALDAEQAEVNATATAEDDEAARHAALKTAGELLLARFRQTRGNVEHASMGVVVEPGVLGILTLKFGDDHHE